MHNVIEKTSWTPSSLFDNISGLQKRTVPRVAVDDILNNRECDLERRFHVTYRNVRSTVGNIKDVSKYLFINPWRLPLLIHSGCPLESQRCKNLKSSDVAGCFAAHQFCYGSLLDTVCRSDLVVRKGVSICPLMVISAPFSSSLPFRLELVQSLGR